jgi:hypothetical protein
MDEEARREKATAVAIQRYKEHLRSILPIASQNNERALKAAEALVEGSLLPQMIQEVLDEAYEEELWDD